MRSILPALAVLVPLALPFLAPARPACAGPARELVVSLAPAPDGAAVARARAERRFTALGLRVTGVLGAGLPAWPSAAVAPARVPSGFDPSRVMLLEAADPAAAAAALAALHDDASVEWAEPNALREPADAPGDPGFPDDPYFASGRQWALENRGPSGPFGGVAGADIRARAAWGRSVGGPHVLLAVADTGIDPAHPEFVAWLPDGRPRLEPGIDATLETAGATAAVDSFGHGTPVAGVMAARTNEGPHFDSLGVAGVCGGDGVANPGCRLLAIKITRGRNGYSTSYEIARAALLAAAAGARAMNLSYAGSQPTRVERLALHHALVRGCVVVAAAGNRGASAPTAPQYPAAFAADGLCIQVGASDPHDRRSVFSSYGPGLDLLAPGESIWTTFMTYPSAAGASYPGYVVGAGTSFAAPHVAGAVGLLVGARPELTDTDLQHVLRESARDIGPLGPDAASGWGVLDAAAALAAVDPAIGILHDETAATAVRSLGVSTLFVGSAGQAGERMRIHDGAEQLELRAVVAVPDSFLGPVRVWPRVGGTSTARGGFVLPYLTPWSEVEEREPRAFTLRGYLYHAGAGTDDETFVPVPLDQARFGYTVMGRVDRAPSLAVTAPAPGATLRLGERVTLTWTAADPDSVTAVSAVLEPADGAARPLGEDRPPAGGLVARLPCAGLAAGPARLVVTAEDTHGAWHDRTTVVLPVTLAPGPCEGPGPGGATPILAAPNPFQGRTWIAAPGPATLRIVDLGGRVVARRASGPGVEGWDWDGRDDAGRRLPAGLYFARIGSGGAQRTVRLVRLD
jgi:subtilisin family serine protease